MSTNPTAGQPPPLGVLLREAHRHAGRTLAALDLLDATSIWSHQAARDCATMTGYVNWSALRVALTTGEVLLPTAERRMALLALSLAAPYIHVSLGECLTGLDDVQAGAVLAAVRRALEGGAR